MSYRGIGAASTMFEHAVQMCWLIDIAGFKRATSSMKSSYPYARSGQTIGLLGGSFDPAHAGHAHITREALKRFGVDRVWWMVSPGNPLKDRGPAPIEQRMERARSVMDHPRVEVTDIERQLGTRYTAQTLQALQARYRGVRFVWLMGADNLAQFHLWQDWQWTSPHGACKMLHVCNRHVRLCGGVGGQVHRGRAHPAGTPSPTCSAHDARMVADFA